MKLEKSKFRGNQLSWCGHLVRMNDNRWTKRICKWSPPVKRKTGRIPRSWTQGISQAVDSKNLQDGEITKISNLYWQNYPK